MSEHIHKWTKSMPGFEVTNLGCSDCNDTLIITGTLSFNSKKTRIAVPHSTRIKVLQHASKAYEQLELAGAILGFHFTSDKENIGEATKQINELLAKTRHLIDHISGAK